MVRPDKIMSILRSCILKLYHELLTRMAIYRQPLIKSSCIAYRTKMSATHNKKRQREISASSKIPAKCSKIESNNICHTCDISFTLYKDLIRHNESVHEEKKHECPICSQKFGRSDTLNRHIKLLHGKITISIANL